jgi:hypothetical protein
MLLDEVRQINFASKRKNKTLAASIGVHPSTIGNINSGKTKWPRPTTLFPLIGALGYTLQLVPKEEPDEPTDKQFFPQAPRRKGGK